MSPAPGRVAAEIFCGLGMKALDPKIIFGLLKTAAVAWKDSKAPRLGAALAFYTIFAIAPMFVIALAISGLWFGPEAARGQLFAEISGLVGPQGGKAIEAVVAAANAPKAGTWATIVAIVTVFAGATGVFVELQDAINSIWGVRREAGRGVRRWIRDRLLS